jgi:glutamate:GABA antiporter
LRSARHVVSIAILGVLVRQIALMSIYFAGNTRLPMVAGWDRLLPAWFTRLHPNYKTPVNSILFVGIIALALGLASLINVNAQEAFQLLDNAGGVFYAATYLVLFAIPLIGMKAFGVRAPWWHKSRVCRGSWRRLSYICYAPVPITPVESYFWFGFKIVATVVVANAVGVAVYVLGKRRSV